MGQNSPWPMPSALLVSAGQIIVQWCQEVTTVAHDMLLHDICNILPKLPFTLNSFLSPHAAMTLP